MIDTKELQIGNWVEFLCFDKSEIRVQITEINSEGYVDGKSDYGSSHWCNTKDIQPIPLTREILEKNGFEEFDSWLIYNQEETGIEISWLGTILKISGECGNLELPAIMYVHQLQNVLSICGIEKEIKL